MISSAQGKGRVCVVVCGGVGRVRRPLEPACGKEPAGASRGASGWADRSIGLAMRRAEGSGKRKDALALKDLSCTI